MKLHRIANAGELGDRGAGPRVTCGSGSWPVAALVRLAAVGARTRLKQGRKRSILDLL